MPKSDQVVASEFEQSIFIRAPAELVWAYLTEVELMNVWMSEPEMRLEIETDWKAGAPITMRGPLLLFWHGQRWRPNCSIHLPRRNNPYLRRWRWLLAQGQGYL